MPRRRTLDALDQALQLAVQDPTFGTRMADLGAAPAATVQATPASLRSFLKLEIASWGVAIKRAGVSPD